MFMNYKGYTPILKMRSCIQNTYRRSWHKNWKPYKIIYVSSEHFSISGLEINFFNQCRMSTTLYCGPWVSCSMLPVPGHPPRPRRSPSICMHPQKSRRKNRVQTHRDDSEQRPRWNVVLASITGKRPSSPMFFTIPQLATPIVANSILLLNISAS